MEDDSGLELSLGLSFGGLSAKSKAKSSSSTDLRIEEGDKGNKLVDDFKSFLHPGTQKQESSTASQRSESVKPKENFFNDLSKVNVDKDASVDLNGKGVWESSNKSAEFESEKRAESGSKRRMFFEEMNQQKKHEREANYADLNEKARTSHISLTTEDGSTAENEDVAESEVEGSTSRLVLQHDDGSKRFMGIGGSSDVQKEARGISDSKAVDPNGQKRFNGSLENGFKLGNMSYGSPFTGQPINMMNMPFPLPLKDSNNTVTPSTSAPLMPGVMQVIPTANSEGPGTHPGNLPVMFGYSPVQIPMLDKDNSWGLVSQSQQFHPSYAGRGPPNSAVMQVISHNSSEATQHEGRTSERPKGDGKQHTAEGGSSSQAEDGKGSSTNLRGKDAPDRSSSDGSSLEFSTIKPGIHADVKFGGSGSRPNLPWVSTTAPGPNGRTISGVTYKYNANQVRIVCACHGSHMSPDEFVRHASEDPGNPESGTGLTTFPNNNSAASAQS
ncbi:ninja-family protein mc410 [Humulus lupulus]|uniref:ninja-family protein mc410 n=1 Tax=Humulus lupulus TaxID=3486 RepID=UPI002B414291|nr:ninja-family protein mc410 [Humulus lupulus]